MRFFVLSDVLDEGKEAVNAVHKLALWRREEKREDNSQKRGKREAHGRCRTQ
jgi:hypothetical protein